MTDKSSGLFKQFRLLGEHFPWEIFVLLITLPLYVYMMKMAIEIKESGYAIPLFGLGMGAFVLTFFNMLWFIKCSYDRRNGDAPVERDD